LPANPSATALYEVVTSTVNDVGHLQRRSVHALRDTPLPLNLAQRHQGWLNHTRMRPPLSKRLRSSRHSSRKDGEGALSASRPTAVKVSVTKDLLPSGVPVVCSRTCLLHRSAENL
jgi:hypothetical protein